VWDEVSLFRVEFGALVGLVNSRLFQLVSEGVPSRIDIGTSAPNFRLMASPPTSLSTRSFFKSRLFGDFPVNAEFPFPPIGTNC